MIYVKMEGRMGNQMFQYAYARKIQLQRNNRDIIALDFSGMPQDKGSYSKNYLEELKCSDNIIVKEYKFSLIQRLLLKFIKNGSSKHDKKEIIKFQKRYADLIGCFGLYIYRSGYHHFNISHKKKNIYLSGNFESHKYFDDIKEILIEDFRPNSMSAENSKLYKEILESEYIAICVRRGDFVDSRHKSKLDICGVEYYRNALSELEYRVGHKCKIIIFTEDVKWAYENLDFVDKSTMFIGDAISPWEQMMLMRACNYFIIGNSTYHWWAQYLCEKKEKIVVAPKYWNSDKIQTDLYQLDWILIDPNIKK